MAKTSAPASPSPKPAASRARARVAALIWTSGSGRAWQETIQTILMSTGVDTIRIAVPDRASAAAYRLADARASTLVVSTFPEAMEALIEQGFDQILVVLTPIAAPHGLLTRASEWMSRDARLATVSFMSNTAGHLSFPHRNTPVPMGVEGHDENTLTSALRTRTPDSGPVPIAAPDGGAVLVSALAITSAGGLPSSGGEPNLVLADLAVLASNNGFLNCLDAGTYITSPWEWRRGGPPPSGLSHEQQQFLARRRAAFPAIYADDRDSLVSPLSQALDLARAKAQGLRILVDGTCLGPQEMGTQLLVMALTKSLLRRRDVRSVCLAVPDPHHLPAYVQDVKSMSKLTLVRSDGLRFPDAPPVDIIHRPYQPDSPIPWDRWRELGKRSLITIQDLIAYRNGAYFPSWDEWKRYRTNLTEQVSQADGIISISHDVVASIREERLRIADNRLFVVENGIDYRHADGEKTPPPALLERGWADTPFLFVLGATYFHKNRDLAVKVWQGLRRRGHDLKLVLAGANVPRGSTRTEEALLLQGEADVLKLPDVSGPERDWLMSRTRLVLYPTSAEGFGQMPFEAARFGKPSLYVAFGPLAELIDDDGAPRTWDLEGLIDRAETLITDQVAADEAARRALGKLSTLGWENTAAKSVEAYFDLLGLIPNPG
jgi:glycosyltransferase involved in cell wall biosynthesis